MKAKAVVVLGLIFLAGLFRAGAPAARAESPSLERLKYVAEQLVVLETISGRFTLEKSFEHLDGPVVSQGRFFFARPDFLLWEQRTPAWTRLEVNGDRVEAWAGSPDQPVRRPEMASGAARQVIREIMTWMKFEPRAIAAVYEVILESPEPLTLKAWPRRPGLRKYLDSIQIEFSADRRVVRRVVLSEALSRSVLTFDQVVFDQPRPGP